MIESDSTSDRSSDTNTQFLDKDQDECAVTLPHAKAESIDSKPLRIVGGYLLLQEIGRGGMGVVYEATDTQLHRQVALKELPHGASHDRSRVKRFNTEWLAAAQLNHPNIVPVYEANESDGVNYYVMQLIHGRNLSQIVGSIRRELSRFSPAKTPEKTTNAVREATDLNEPVAPRHDSSRPPIPRSATPEHQPIDLSAADFSHRSGRYASTPKLANTVARIGVQVADALQHTHEVGIVHRDIKPSNLMLDYQGRIWVADFGLAHIKGSSTMTQIGVPIGTYRYMSPEQATGMHGLVDHRTDIYSLGVTLSELLILKPLFEGRDNKDIVRRIVYGDPPKIRQIDPSVPEDLAVILEKAMARDPLDRYVTAREMADDLNRFVHHQPINGRRLSWKKRCKYWILRHRGVATAACVVLAAIFLTSTVAAAFFQRQASTFLLALKQSESFRAVMNAQLALPSNPGLSVQLAKLAVQLMPGYESRRCLQRALDANHEYVAVMPRDHVSSCVALNPIGDTAVTCASGTSATAAISYPATIHSLKDGSTLSTLDSGEHITGATYSHSGRYILTTSKIQRASANNAGSPPALWDAHTGKLVRRFESGSLDRANPGTLHPNLERALIRQGNEAVVYDIENGRELARLRGHTDTLFYAEYSPDGKRMLTISNDLSIRIWDSETAKETRPPITWVQKDGRDARATFVSTSDAVIVSEGFSAKRFPVIVSSESTSADDSLSTVDTFVSRAHEQFISRESRKLLVRSSRNFQQICELEIPSEPSSPDGSTRLMTDLRAKFHPQEMLAVAVSGARAYVFETANGRLLGQLSGHQFNITDFGMSGDRIATVANDKMLRLWRKKSGLAQRTFGVRHNQPSSSGTPRHFALSPDNRSLAIATGAIYQSTRRDSNGEAVPGMVNGALPPSQTDGERLLTIDGNDAIVTEWSTSRELYRGGFNDQLYFESQLVANGERFVAFTLNFKAWLVDIRTHARMPLGTQSEEINGVYVSPNTSLILMTYINGDIEAIDARTGTRQWTRQHANRVTYVDFSPDSRQLAFVDNKGIIELRTLDWEPLHQFSITDQEINRIRILRGSEGIVTWHTHKNTQVRCYQTQSPENYSSLAAPGIVQVDVHPNKPLVAIGSAEGVLLWEPTGTQSQKRLSDRGCRSVCLNNDRIGVLLQRTTSRPGELSVFRFDGTLVKSEALPLSPYRIRADGTGNQFLLTQSGYGADVISFESGDLNYTSPLHTSKLVWFGYSRDSAKLMSVCEQGVISTSDQNGKLLSSSDVCDSKITAAAIDRLGEKLFLGSETGELIAWSTNEEKHLARFAAHQRAIRAIRVSANGNKAVTAAPGESARFWNLETQESVEFNIPNAIHAEISPEGDQALVLAKKTDATTQAWHVNLRDLQIRPIDIDRVRTALFSLEGKRIGLMTDGGGIEILDSVTLRNEHSIELPMERIRSFKFDRDDNHLFIAHGNTCSIWSISDQQADVQIDCKVDFSEPFSSTHLISTDGEWIVAPDNTVAKIRKWPLDPLKYANAFYPRALTSQERKQFRVDLSLLALPNAEK